MPGNFHAVPASVVASWPSPNYVDPVRRGWLPAFSCTFMAFSTILIAGRFYLRARKQAGDFGLDDLFIFIGWAVSIGFTATAVIDSTRNGLDVHTWDVRFDQYVPAAMVGWIAQVLFLISTCATKTSVLLFYRRMVKDAYSRKWLYAIWAALFGLFAYFVAVLFTYCFICQPLSAYWESYDFNYNKTYTCINGDILSPLVGVLSIISDLYAVLLPSVMLRHYNLDVPKRQKIGLNIIFALGLIVAGCGIARTYYLWGINHTYDTSWVGFDLFVWSLLECHLAVIFACAPSLRAFLRRYLGDAMTRTFRSGNYNHGQSRTKDSQNASTLRNSTQQMEDLGGKKTQSVVDQRVLTKSSEETMGYDRRTEALSTRSKSSDTVPRMRSAEEYEAYALQQLSRHGYKRSNGSEHVIDMADPRLRHDVDDTV